MRSSCFLAAFAATTISVAAAAKLPDLFSLTVPRTNFPDTLIWNNLMYVTNSTSFIGSVWIGNIRYALVSEPLLASGGGDEIGFTSIHQALTGFTSLFVFPNDSLPVGFTVPHAGGAPPTGAVTEGFYLTAGNTIALNGTAAGVAGKGGERWVACEESVGDANQEPSWRIYWDGKQVLSGSEGCVDVPLDVTVEAGGDCRLP